MHGWLACSDRAAGPLTENPTTAFPMRVIGVDNPGDTTPQVHRDESHSQQAYIKYVVLDPASHFHELVRECRAVVLAGGTMKPTEEFRQQLFLGAGARQDRVQEFCCGHVVPQDNILPVAVTAGPTGLALNLTHQSRHNIDMVSKEGGVSCGYADDPDVDQDDW